MIEDDITKIEMNNNESGEGCVSADEWFRQGRRVLYDPCSKKIVPNERSTTISVFERVVAPFKTNVNTRWLTMLPGFPDGSYTYAKVDDLIQASPRLYIEFVGFGDSDKPKDYKYSIMERADLVEAQWKIRKIRRTVLVSCGNSSLVMMELLRRQSERQAMGLVIRTRIEHILSINGGYFADGHTPHPLNKTPIILKTVGNVTARAAQHCDLVSQTINRKWFSQEYNVSKSELREMENAVRRHDGAAIIPKVSTYIDEHERYQRRWNLYDVYLASRSQDVSFTLVASEQDPFEPKQVIMATEHLGQCSDVYIQTIPGGYKATSEQPHQVAAMIDALAMAPAYVYKDHEFNMSSTTCSMSDSSIFSNSYASIESDDLSDFFFE